MRDMAFQISRLFLFAERQHVRQHFGLKAFARQKGALKNIFDHHHAARRQQMQNQTFENEARAIGKEAVFFRFRF